MIIDCSPHSNMSDKFDGGKIFVNTISVAILIRTFAAGSHFVQQSLAQDLGQGCA